MDPRRLPGPVRNEPRFGPGYGRRATDGATPSRHHSAAFVAQVAGLALPVEGGAGAYAEGAPKAPTGLVADARA